MNRSEQAEYDRLERENRALLDKYGRGILKYNQGDISWVDVAGDN